MAKYQANTFIWHLDNLGIIPEFIAICKQCPPVPQIREWAKSKGVPWAMVPVDLKGIRKKLGCSAPHGGKRNVKASTSIIRNRR